MICPKCDEYMEIVKFQLVEVNRCTFCKGIWFDSLVKEHLKNLKGSESIDIGDKKTGEQFDKITNLKCPNCYAKMINMVDIHQSHIRFESCTLCYGAFFDAGEFKDYKDDNILSYFKSIFAQERR